MFAAQYAAGADELDAGSGAGYGSYYLVAAWALLRSEGVLIVAVPPVYNAESRAANLANPYHLNIWTPRQWHYALGRYFGRVDCVRHHIEFYGRTPNFVDAPEMPQFGADEFVFLPS